MGLLSTYCGQDAIPRDTDSLPWIGCLYISRGHKTAGEIEHHQVEISVDQDGLEHFVVDDTPISFSRSDDRTASGTNLPFVRTGAVAGINLCSEQKTGFCPSRISVHSRNPDKSVLFEIMQCLPPTYQRCVMTKKNWDYEIAAMEHPAPKPPTVAIPSGPYSSWPQDQRATIIKTLLTRCVVFTGMVGGDGKQTPPLPWLEAVSLICLDRRMPDDWPDRAINRTKWQKDIDEARKIDPSLPDPESLFPKRTSMGSGSPPR